MKTLKSFTFSDFGSRTGRTYDWDVLFDGKIRQLEPGKDFDGKIESFRVAVSKQAVKRGLKVRCAVVKDKEDEEKRYLVMQCQGKADPKPESNGETEESNGEE